LISYSLILLSSHPHIVSSFKLISISLHRPGDEGESISDIAKRLGALLPPDLQQYVIEPLESDVTVIDYPVLQYPKKVRMEQAIDRCLSKTVFSQRLQSLTYLLLFFQSLKVKSLKLDRDAPFEKKLVGIKGTYLIFDDGELCVESGVGVCGCG
jgi:hypothetical protein